MRRTCKTCKHWEPFSGACGNGNSRFRGDFKTGDECCTKHEWNVHQGCGGVLEARIYNNKVDHYCYRCLLYVLGAFSPCERTEQGVNSK